jgi:short-subunit dehydrogenase
MTQNFKTIVITGAGGGIGAALAGKFAGPGVTLGLIGRDAAKLDAVASRCRGQGATVETVSVDVRDQARLENWLATFDAAHPIDLLIANAGITYPLPSAELHEPMAELTKILDTNFYGVMHTVFPVIERMAGRRRGHLAIVSSLSAYHGMPAFPAYAASKAALLNYFQGLRGRLAASGIDLTIVCPGYIHTPMTRSLPGTKWLVYSADAAARIMTDGISARKPLIAFPLVFRIGLWLLNMLPVKVSDWILNRV